MHGRGWRRDDHRRPPVQSGHREEVVAMATSTAGPGAGPAHTHHTRSTVARAALSLLAVLALYQGIWAQLAPRSFFEGFPGGMGWIATEGPYNEHLVRDVGG